jgi:predicted MPP superfamily phosphohydrolase
MHSHQRNVRLDGRPDRHLVERVLLAHPFLNRFIACCGEWALAALIWPRFVAPFRWELTWHDLPLAGVDAAFEEYRILQLTDFHVGKTRMSYLTRAVERCLDEKPDLIVLTGDFIDYHPRSLPLLKPLLARIAARAGSDGACAVLGNHDYHEYSWRHVGARSARRAIHRRLIDMIQSAGIRLLRNEQLRLTRGGGTLTIVGLDEMWTGRADAAAAFRGLAPGAPVICLQHNPDGIDFLSPYPWQFLLCGHAHGGQACFPMLGPLYVPMVHRQYLRGFFHFPPVAGQPAALRERTMFVSRGLGYSTPIRMRCRPEATVFTVRRT